MTPWKRRFLLETIIFRCYVSFKEGKIYCWIYLALKTDRRKQLTLLATKKHTNPRDFRLKKLPNANNPTTNFSLLGCPREEVRINVDGINGLFHLLINGEYWGLLTHLLTIDSNFLGHPSIRTYRIRFRVFFFRRLVGQGTKNPCPVVIQPLRTRAWQLTKTRSFGGTQQVMIFTYY